MNPLERILRFAQSTGDKVIVTDPQGRDPMVVMPFGMYEHLISTGRKAVGIGVVTADHPLSAPFHSSKLSVEEVPPLPDDLDLQPSVSEPTPVGKGEEPSPGEEEAFYLEPVE